MIRYSYAFDVKAEDEEAVFIFSKFPEIISAVDWVEFKSWSPTRLAEHAEDAVLTALQAIIKSRVSVPTPDEARASEHFGLVHLSPLIAMKLELYKQYIATCPTITDFARKINKQDTTARRLINLRHRSSTSEIEDALAELGGRFVHKWDVVKIGTAEILHIQQKIELEHSQ